MKGGMASCRYANNFDDSESSNHKESSNLRHEHRKKNLAVADPRGQGVRQGMVSLQKNFLVTKAFLPKVHVPDQYRSHEESDGIHERRR